MKSTIDALSSATGWAGSGATVTIPAVNEIAEYIAGLANAGSLIIKFAGGSNGAYAQKTITFDATNFNDIVFHIWSRNKGKSGLDYQDPDDFAYKIDFGGVEYYLPTLNGFCDVTLDCSALTSLTRIRITCLHDEEDYIIISNMLAVKDELPLDIFQGVKDHMEYDIGRYYQRMTGGVASKGVNVGTFSGAAGANSITVEAGLKWVERYALVRLDDGVNSEIHQIDRADGVMFYFSSMYAGDSLVNTFSSGTIYLIIPAEFGVTEREIMLPGISIWGMSPEEVMRGGKIENEYDSYMVSNSVGKQGNRGIFMYNILVDCEARHEYIIAFMSRIVRAFIAREFVWVNGKKLNVKAIGPGSYIEPVEGYNEIPKIQYQLQVEVKEEIFDREEIVKANTHVRTYTVSEETL